MLPWDFLHPKQAHSCAVIGSVANDGDSRAGVSLGVSHVEDDFS